VAARLSGNDPEVARKTAAFLDKQTQLLETQNERANVASRVPHVHSTELTDKNHIVGPVTTAFSHCADLTDVRACP
jgi:hypothetical protein